jgi:hypothetical protein
VSEWKTWFAWRPVIVLVSPYKQKIRWLCRLRRRWNPDHVMRSIWMDDMDMPAGGWEYAPLETARPSLSWGHFHFRGSAEGCFVTGEEELSGWPASTLSRGRTP